LVRKIRNGTVIDHIPAGNALNVLRIIGVKGDEGFRLSIIINTFSEKLGKKDIVKIEDKELTSDEVDMIALIAPTATLNIIRDYRVVSKRRVEVPDRVVGIVRCGNPNCITNQEKEGLRASFIVESKDKLLLRCEYCGRSIGKEEVLIQFR
jgi:aspartate carbamoyltransferase regulatory subunit